MKSKNIYKIFYLVIMLLSTSCSAIMETVNPPTPTPTPTQTPTPTLIPTPTLTPTITSLPTLSVNPEEFDHWDVLIPGYDFFPEGLTYTKTGNVFNINWEGHVHVFDCGKFYGKIGPEGIVDYHKWYINETPVVSPTGYPTEIDFTSEKFDLMKVQQQFQATKEPGTLRLIFDPSVTCNFVVTDKQEKLLDEEDWSKRFEERTQPYAVGRVLLEPSGRAHNYGLQVEHWGRGWPWAYDYLDGNEMVERKVTKFGYLYLETGEAFTWDRDNHEHSPAVIVVSKSLQDRWKANYGVTIK